MFIVTGQIFNFSKNLFKILFRNNLNFLNTFDPFRNLTKKVCDNFIQMFTRNSFDFDFVSIAITLVLTKSFSEKTEKKIGSCSNIFL